MTSPDGDPTARPRPGGARADGGEDVTADQFHEGFRDTPYYSTGRTWADYEPAYRYAIETHAAHVGQNVDDVEAILERGWEDTRGRSRLAWAEAQGAIRVVWQRLGRHPPAGSDTHD